MGELKPGWRWVKLGDVVDNVNDYYDRNSTEAERYIAGEHIDEGSLMVRRWGETTDDLFPPTFNRRFRTGDILFHSRNLRKIACPDFDGVTGEKLFVLRVSRPDLLLPSLLPFLLQTRQFDEYVNRMWAGSTNKFLNKTPLMKYEFTLPPLEEQRRMVLVLSAAERSLEAARDAIQASRSTYTAALADTFIRRHPSPGITPECWGPLGWSCVALEALTLTDAPICYGIVQPGLSVKGGVPTVTSNNLNIGFRDKIHLTRPDIESSYERSRVRGGDVLVTVKGFGTGNVAIVPEFFNGNITRDVARIRVDQEVDAKFFVHLWKSPAFDRYWRAVSVGTTRPELSIGKLRAMTIPWPAAEVRHQVTSYLGALEHSTEQLETRAKQNQELQVALIQRSLNEGVAGGAT